MSFFDDIGKKISRSNAVHKAKDMGDIASLTSKINKLDASLKEAYCQLGMKYYKQFAADPDEHLTELIIRINEISREKNESVKQRAGLRGAVICPNCGAECGAELRFCTSCGTRLPELQKEFKKESSVRFCTQCGQKVEKDAMFCSLCGKSLK